MATYFRGHEFVRHELQNHRAGAEVAEATEAERGDGRVQSQPAARACGFRKSDRDLVNMLKKKAPWNQTNGLLNVA